MFSLQPIKGGTSFFQSELDSALRHIKSKRNILVLAPDNFGKSSFLLSLSERIHDPRHVPVIFSAKSCIDLNSYIKKNLLSIMSAYPGIFGSDPKLFFSFSIIEIDSRIAELKISDSAKQILKLLLLFEHDPKTDMNEVVESFFSLPSILAAETRTTAVVMIDDLHLLPAIKSDKTSLSAIVDLLSKADSGSAVFVAASSLHLHLEGFEELELSLPNIDDIGRFFSDNHVELGDAQINAVHNLTAGIPLYVNFIARRISISGAKDVASINALFDDAVSNELHLYFSERIKQLSPKELPILFCIAEHKVNTPSRISRIINYSQTNVRRFLSIMEEKGFVTLKDRGVFEIHDPVLRRWLEIQSRS